MVKKRGAKRWPWNKGLEVGKRDGFTPAQVKRIRNLLAGRGVPGLRDLALFSTAIDTMLHGQDLLALVVGDVQRRDCSIRPVIEVARARGMPPVRCALSNAGNNIRQMAKEMGVADAFDFPGFMPAYIRPLFCRGIGPFRWAALSGEPEDIFRTDAKVKELMPNDAHLHNWLDLAKSRIRFQGLPARICWVGLGDRHRLGLAFNEMVASGELKAPIVIGRDHLDAGSVASPNRETEAMKDGSDAVSDWPLLNAPLNCASGATWVSFHHGGGVGIGYSQHAGMVVVCDGTQQAARRIERVLWNDPASGSCGMLTRVMRMRFPVHAHTV